MLKIIFFFIPVIFWGVFLYIVLTVPYPESLTQANLMQIAPLFMSLYLAITFTINIVFRNFLSSLSITLGIILLLILNALDSLNIVTAILTLIPIALLYSYFRNRKKYNPLTSSGFRHLTKQTKMPKLTKQI